VRVRSFSFGFVCNYGRVFFHFFFQGFFFSFYGVWGLGWEFWDTLSIWRGMNAHSMDGYAYSTVGETNVYCPLRTSGCASRSSWFHETFRVREPPPGGGRPPPQPDGCRTRGGGRLCPSRVERCDLQYRLHLFSVPLMSYIVFVSADGAYLGMWFYYRRCGVSRLVTRRDCERGLFFFVYSYLHATYIDHGGGCERGE